MRTDVLASLQFVVDRIAPSFAVQVRWPVLGLLRSSACKQWSIAMCAAASTVQATCAPL